MAVLVSQDYSAVREPEEAFDAPTELDPLEAQGARHAEAAVARCKPNPAAVGLIRAAQAARTVSARVVWLQRAASAWAQPLVAVGACSRGCAHCCHIPLAMTDVEARVIGSRIGRAPAAVVDGPTTDQLMDGAMALPGTPPLAGDPYASPCPFLREGSCSIYEFRPVACRTQVNLDASAALCELRRDAKPRVPYADATMIKAAYVMAQPAARWADVRAFFPAGPSPSPY